MEDLAITGPAEPALVSVAAGNREVPQQPSRSAELEKQGESRDPPISASLSAEVKRLNGLLGRNTQLRFVLDETSSDVHIEVVDVDNARVLRTIPPSKLGEIATGLRNGGLLFDNKS